MGAITSYYTMEKRERSKVVATTIVLTIQLKEWVTFAREMGAMNGRFKYLSGILLNALSNMLKFLFEGHDQENDEAYEHSVKLSDVISEFIELDDEQQRRVLGLIRKIKAGT